jgi:hypothetical protein
MTIERICGRSRQSTAESEFTHEWMMFVIRAQHDSAGNRPNVEETGNSRA